MTDQRNQASKQQDKPHPQEPVHVSRADKSQQRQDQAEFNANMSGGERNKRARGTDLNAPENDTPPAQH